MREGPVFINCIVLSQHDRVNQGVTEGTASWDDLGTKIRNWECRGADHSAEMFGGKSPSFKRLWL